MTGETRSATLHLSEGTADKEYQIHLVARSGGFAVDIAFGRRGAALKHDTKTPDPVAYDEAVAIYERLLRKKLNQGHVEVEGGMSYVGTEAPRADSGVAPQLPTAIQPSDVPTYENDDAWVAQQKHDGENRMIVVEDGRIGGVNRRGLTNQVPAHWRPSDVLHAHGRTVLCGEDMGATLVVFDAVEIDGRDIRHLSFVDRHAELAAMVAAAGSPAWMVLEPIHAGTEAKKALLRRMIDEDGEGVIYKRADAAFEAGRNRNSLKHKILESTTFEVLRHNSQRSIALGLHDEDGDMVQMGNVSVPANQPMPAIGALVEVEYLYRFEGGALMQPKYKGERTDIEGPVMLDQIQRIKTRAMAA